MVPFALESERDRARSAHDGVGTEETGGELLELPPLTSENDEKCSGGEIRTHNLAGPREEGSHQHSLE